MTKQTSVKILWGEANGSYIYGSTITYHAKEQVTFTNPLMASGNEIKNWNSIHNYQAARIQPALPLLKRGMQYRLKGNFETQPANTAFLKLVFFNRYNEEVETLISKEKDVVFTYPQEAYSYKVILLSAGLEVLEFRSLSLERVRGEDV